MGMWVWAIRNDKVNMILLTTKCFSKGGNEDSLSCILITETYTANFGSDDYI